MMRYSTLDIDRTISNDLVMEPPKTGRNYNLHSMFVPKAVVNHGDQGDHTAGDHTVGYTSDSNSNSAGDGSDSDSSRVGVLTPPSCDHPKDPNTHSSGSTDKTVVDIPDPPSIQLCDCISRRVEISNIPVQYHIMLINIAETVGQLEYASMNKSKHIFQYFNSNDSLKLKQTLQSRPYFTSISFNYILDEPVFALLIDLPWKSTLSHTHILDTLKKFGEIEAFKVEYVNNYYTSCRVYVVFQDSRISFNQFINVEGQNLPVLLVKVPHDFVCDSKRAIATSSPIFRKQVLPMGSTGTVGTVGPMGQVGPVAQVGPVGVGPRSLFATTGIHNEWMPHVDDSPETIRRQSLHSSSPELKPNLAAARRNWMIGEAPTVQPAQSAQSAQSTKRSNSDGLKLNKHPQSRRSLSHPTLSSQVNITHGETQNSIFDKYTHPPKPNSNKPNAKSTLNSGTEIDLDLIAQKLETRTTIMLRNIPNKLEFKDLKRFLDATNAKTYDFLYLRFDFENRCNVGYAFISFISPKHVAQFMKARAGMKWSDDGYNSEKIIDVKFARIQGRANLIEKFRNSPVMNHDAKFRPRLYYSKGPLRGTEEPFPSPSINL